MELTPIENIKSAFRWIRETIELIYKHHRHPLPMATLIFVYIETLGKALVMSKKITSTTENKLVEFVSEYMPDLWHALVKKVPREAQKILADYRNGLAHQIFMKGDLGIHETAVNPAYVLSSSGVECSINVDLLVKEFLAGMTKYEQRVLSDKRFGRIFDSAISEQTAPLRVIPR